jgi:5-methylcytosine-specific restriction endonuclease McrA
MPTINPYKWQRLYNRQDGRYYYCLQPFSDKRNGVNALKKATVDHVKPKCELKDLEYKEQTYCNTVLACTECNRRKANISAELFLE